MRLTRRGWGVLGATVVLLVAGELLGYPVLVVLAGTGLGALAAALLSARRPPRLEVSRVLYPDRVECGRPALARLIVRNTSGRFQPGFEANDVAGTDDRAVVVAGLAPGGTATYHYELPTVRRGVQPVGPLTLRHRDVLGLVRHEITVGDAISLWVHPRRYPALPASGAGHRHHYDGLPSTDALRGSMDLRRLREYMIGDEPRHVHWKASARTGQLMVREYVDPGQPRLTLLLDTRSRALTPDEFEAGVSVAASIMSACAAAGQRLRLATTTGVDRELPSVRSLLDELTTIAQEPSDLPVMPHSLGTSGAGGLLVISGGTAVDTLYPVTAARPRYAPMVFVDLARQKSAGPSMAGVRVVRGRSAEGAVTAWNAMLADGAAS